METGESPLEIDFNKSACDVRSMCTCFIYELAILPYKHLIFLSQLNVVDIVHENNEENAYSI